MNTPQLPPMIAGDQIYVGESELESYRAAALAAGLNMEWAIISEGTFAGAWRGMVKDTKASNKPA